MLEPFDERAHESLVRAHAASGALGDARRAEERYRAAMIELGVKPRPCWTDHRRPVERFPKTLRR